MCRKGKGPSRDFGLCLIGTAGRREPEVCGQEAAPWSRQGKPGGSWGVWDQLGMPVDFSPFCLEVVQVSFVVAEEVAGWR